MPISPYAQTSIQNQPTLPLPGQVVDTAQSFFDDRPNPGPSAQSVSITVTAPTALDVLYIDILGERASVVSTGTAATDAAALRVAFNSNPILAGMFTAAGAGAIVLLTAVARGYDLTVTVSIPAKMVLVNTPASNGTTFECGRPLYFNAGAMSLTAPAGTDTTNIADRIVGITTRRYNREGTDPSNEPAMQPAAPRRVEMLVSGRIGVRDGLTAAYRDPLYIGIANADIGKFFTTAGADRALLPARHGYWLGPCEVMLRFGR